jgi:hypothetical protein
MQKSKRIALFLLSFLVLNVFVGAEEKDDSDKLLRDILVNYYNTLERHKQQQQQQEIELEEHELELEKEQIEEEEEEEEPVLDFISESLSDIALDYIRDHLKSRIWSGFSGSSPGEEEEAEKAKKPTHRVHDYTNANLWWEHEEVPGVGGQRGGDGGGMPYPGYPVATNKDGQTRRMVNRVFTASGFALSLVVLVVFFFSCAYCWCISSPSKMLGTLSTILAIMLLLHRLHEFFLVFSVEDIKNVGGAFLGTEQGM